MTWLARAVVVAALASAGAGSTAAAAPGLFFGFSDSAPEWYGDAAVAPARDLGARAFRITLYWNPGETDLDAARRAAVGQAVAAASRHGLSVVLSIHADSPTKAPVDAAARSQYCAFARRALARFPAIHDVVIWNEPNSSTFWRPQFNADGTSAAPAAYQALLAHCYDVLHASRPSVNVVGLATAPHGDDATSHSPGNFIRRLGEAYARSLRPQPLFDTVAHHVYGDSYGERPWRRHVGSKTIAQGDWNKLMSNLAAAFGATPQRIPGECAVSGCTAIWYLESGFQTEVAAAKTASYTGQEVSAGTLPDSAGGEPSWPAPTADSTAPDQSTQVLDAARLAACQPHVGAHFNFLLFDESRLEGWQSGAYWADRTPKRSLFAFERAIAEINAGAVDCAALKGGLPSADYTEPSPPLQVGGDVLEGPLRAELSWREGTDGESGIAGYRVYRDGSYAGFTAATSFTDAAVAPATEYAYAVFAQDEAGNLSPSAAKLALTTP